MIIGGSIGRDKYGPSSWIDDIELVSPYGNTIPDCLSNLNPFNKGTIHGSGGAAMASGTYEGGIRVSWPVFSWRTGSWFFLPTERRIRIQCIPLMLPYRITNHFLKKGIISHRFFHISTLLTVHISIVDGIPLLCGGCIGRSNGGGQTGERQQGECRMWTTGRTLAGSGQQVEWFWSPSSHSTCCPTGVDNWLNRTFDFNHLSSSRAGLWQQGESTFL